MWTTVDLKTESDVEQKFIFPFLVEQHPTGLGIPATAIQTKSNLRSFPIGKGNEGKVYYPDYVVVNLGMPLVVIEAKGPGEKLLDGYREARLYAAELNALYGTGTAPTNYVLACNGIDLAYGYWDAASPIATVRCEDLSAYSPTIAELLKIIGWASLVSYSEQLAKKVRPTEIFKPRRMIGGVAVQNEEIGHNSFGETISVAIAPVFNPTTRAERAKVARDAYVASRRRERYIDPIDRVIRAAMPASETESTLIEDTGKPKELLSKLRDKKDLEHKVLLLIGSVGSGKSTFVDHLQEVALPKEIVSSMVWCRLNMNLAPVSKDEIYPWLRQGIANACRDSLPELDFEELDTIKKLYGIEIRAFDKGVGQLYKSDPITYAVKLAEHISALQADPVATTNAYSRFACAQRGKLLMIVLDNCDKKERDAQLLMFEAAQWLQNEFRALVILPLRDETYDNHRSEPPLDTALKDLVFRIEPPLFQHVLVKRVQLALKELGGSSGERLQYRLPNGMRVEYQRSDQAFYLASIMRSIFDHDFFARRMIVGLAGRDVRRALEIFLEFCRSAYIGDDQIFKIRQSEGSHALPLHQVATVLMRMNRRFYDSDYSYVKNIFASGLDDALPNYFSRYLILRWLRENFRKAGPSRISGYFRKSDLKHALVPYGLSPAVLDREINYLLSSRCVIAEHLRPDSVSDEDLLRLGPAGFVHLDLLSNVNYFAAVAEDTNFVSRDLAEAVAGRIRSPQTHLHLSTVTANASAVVSHLRDALTRVLPPNGSFVEGDLLATLDGFAQTSEAIDRVSRSHNGDAWFSAVEEMAVGSQKQCVVSNVNRYGYFVDFDNGLTGLVYADKTGGIVASAGDRVLVEVLKVNVVQKKIGLRLIAVTAEDAGDEVVVA